MNTSNPLFTLTIEEFSILIRKILNEELQKELAPKVIEYEDEVFNIEGLTKFLNCSKASVHSQCGNHGIIIKNKPFKTCFSPKVYYMMPKRSIIEPKE